MEVGIKDQCFSLIGMILYMNYGLNVKMETNDKEQCENFHLHGFGLQIVAKGNVIEHAKCRYIFLFLPKVFSSFNI